MTQTLSLILPAGLHGGSIALVNVHYFPVPFVFSDYVYPDTGNIPVLFIVDRAAQEAGIGFLLHTPSVTGVVGKKEKSSRHTPNPTVQVYAIRP